MKLKMVFSRDNNMPIWVEILKRFFSVNIIHGVLSKICICMLVIWNSSFIQERIETFQIKFVADYLVVTVSL